MKLWMVKFYELEIPRIINFKSGFFHITPIYSKEEWKEKHRVIVDSEEKANFLVECFDNKGLFRAEKIELIDTDKIMGSTIKEVIIDEATNETKNKK